MSPSDAHRVVFHEIPRGRRDSSSSSSPSYHQEPKQQCNSQKSPETPTPQQSGKSLKITRQCSASRLSTSILQMGFEGDLCGLLAFVRANHSFVALQNTASIISHLRGLCRRNFRLREVLEKKRNCEEVEFLKQQAPT